MDVQLSVRSANAEDDLIALAEWLRYERELQGGVCQLRRPVVEGQLGGAFEMISVAIGSGGIGSVLAGALTTWLQNRPRTTIKITRADVSVEIDASRIKDIAALVGKLLENADDPAR
jgi:Effector Associated Constant Component 1